MQLEIITPERKIFTGEVEAVQLPGKEGLFQVLDNHAAMISTLTNGSVKINLGTSAKVLDKLDGSIERDKSNDTILHFPIKGGVAEVQNNKLILLAD